jgi:membrane protease YdiL (CAAX protease family)
MWIGLVLLSLLSIVILNFAGEVVPGKGFDSTGSYMILGLFSCAVMWWLRPPTMAYFALPRFGWGFLLACALMINLIVVQIRGEDFSQVTSDKWLRGIIFLICVATAEEIFSRGIVFGVLQRHGMTVAVIGSSLRFGLMHINSYIGDFDAWPAYWHIVSAASFGIFACALMVVTRSIWMPIVLHTFSNGGLLLRNAEEVQAQRDSYSSVDFWPGLVQPLPVMLTFVLPALALFWIAAGTPIHPRLHRLGVKWKLIEVKE